MIIALNNSTISKLSVQNINFHFAQEDLFSYTDRLFTQLMKLVFMVKWFLVLSLQLVSVLCADEVGLLYEKNCIAPVNEIELKLVEHVKKSFERACKLDSKLTGRLFEETAASKKWREETLPNYHALRNLANYAGYHLLNNLCALPQGVHLHVGLLAADSFIAALYQNKELLDSTIGIDWFQECPKEIFTENCRHNLADAAFSVINSGCFDIDRSSFNKPVNIYFYDADHSLIGQERAFTYYNPLFATTFIAVVDDWSRPWIRSGTFKAFDRLGYHILYQNVLMDLNDADHGQYVAVIRKGTVESVDDYARFSPCKDRSLSKLKNQLFKKIEGSWCSREKADLIMDLLFQTRPDTCVEVGVYSGSSFQVIVSTLSLIGKGHGYAVDAWSCEEAVRGLSPSDANYQWWASRDMEKVYDDFVKVISNKKLQPHCTVVRSSSAAAAAQFKEIDFLHLDGNFTEQGSVEDIKNYLPKLKSGGYILLSNALFHTANHYQKMKALDLLRNECTIIAEVDHSDTILFRKN